jgi:uracil-DNA glycosylase
MKWMDGIHPSWRELFEKHESLISKIEDSIADEPFCPSPEKVFRAFTYPFEQVKVVIFGQDPYPNPNYACGLAFSVPTEVNVLPQSLANIFKELQSDLGGELRLSGDLSDWSEQGVALINRVLTVPVGESGGHRRIGWQIFTNDIAQELAARGVVAILWGNDAKELEAYFPESMRISSVHPSPLSAYRGFFGSRPFSKANQLLLSRGEKAIDWL